MCQLSFINLHNNMLNRKMFLLTSAIGASVHKHGWGALATENPDEYVKCAIPANLTLNVGDLLKDFNGPLLGHIRLASASVPVTNENAHPFTAENIWQMHNGTLTANDESQHVTHYSVKTVSATGVETTTKIKRSDSEVFFEHFLSVYKEQKDNFTESLKKAMGDFHGKFALMYYIKNLNEIYVVRGKTADLHIMFFRKSEEKTSDIVGYAINTSKEVLETAATILSNFEQVEGRPPLYFSDAELLKEESIFIARDFGVELVGEIKELSYAPSRGGHSYYQRGGWDWGDEGYNVNDKTGEVTKPVSINIAPEISVAFARELYDFMQNYSMTVREMQKLFYEAYACSLTEADEVMMKHFVSKILENLKSKTTRILRKRLSNVTGGRFPASLYYTYEFPWMMNPKDVQGKIINELEKKAREARQKEKENKK